ncbi:proteoglycan 4-like protein [Lates japonicus]|uniref:Proteoglycan 4-like protein n=1 Tax=Lates japonicus TaxID=270547 RepID=A0AAD3N029_LATJO|nr:proteoglycan 4-like protein [Lates japonicus]
MIMGVSCVFGLTVPPTQTKTQAVLKNKTQAAVPLEAEATTAVSVHQPAQNNNTQAEITTNIKIDMAQKAEPVKTGLIQLEETTSQVPVPEPQKVGPVVSFLKRPEGTTKAPVPGPQKVGPVVSFLKRPEGTIQSANEDSKENERSCLPGHQSQESPHLQALPSPGAREKKTSEWEEDRSRLMEEQVKVTSTLKETFLQELEKERSEWERERSHLEEQDERNPASLCLVVGRRLCTQRVAQWRGSLAP